MTSQLFTRCVGGAATTADGATVEGMPTRFDGPHMQRKFLFIYWDVIEPA